MLLLSKPGCPLVECPGSFCNGVRYEGKNETRTHRTNRCSEKWSGCRGIHPVDGRELADQHLPGPGPQGGALFNPTAIAPAA